MRRPQLQTATSKLTDPLAINFINSFQGGVPICENPYQKMASVLETDESILLSLIQSLLAEGWLSRFGPLYDAAQMGGGLTLAALSVPESRFDEVADLVNSHAEVAHNYRRDHKLNMWFVIATETRLAVEQVINQLETETGLKVFNCPKLQEFYIGLKLHVDDAGEVDTVPMDKDWVKSEPLKNQAVTPTELQRKIITATQAGLPLHSEPYEQIAIQVNSDTETVMQSFNSMLENGFMRRVGAVPNHYKLGLQGNGMTVWDVPDEQVNEVGKKIGALGFVSHCYERPRHLPDWPYNLFAMVHGSDKAQVMKKFALMEAELSPNTFRNDVLFSSAVLKKTGLRLAS